MDRARAIEILRDMALPEYGHLMNEHKAAKAGADALVRLHSIEAELAEARRKYTDLLSKERDALRARVAQLEGALKAQEAAYAAEVKYLLSDTREDALASREAAIYANNLRISALSDRLESEAANG